MAYRQAAEKSSCGLSWTILAGLGGASSNHALALGRLPVTGTESGGATGGGTVSEARLRRSSDAFARVQLPSSPVIGAPLDGVGGRYEVIDSESGVLDGDEVWDRAVGPFQFLPATWEVAGIDGNDDGVADPQNLLDAAVSAAELLCWEGAGTNLGGALTAYLGSPTRVATVMAHAGEVGAYWQRLHPQAVGPAFSLLGGGFGGVSQAETVVVRGIRVHTSIADAVQQMIDLAASEGVVLRGWGWRSHEQQIALRAAHCADVWLTPPSQCSPPTAVPGESRHESARAIDFYVVAGGAERALVGSDAEFQWLALNANRFGFYNLASEPWHWSVDGR